MQSPCEAQMVRIDNQGTATDGAEIHYSRAGLWSDAIEALEVFADAFNGLAVKEFQIEFAVVLARDAAERFCKRGALSAAKFAGAITLRTSLSAESRTRSQLPKCRSKA